MAINRILEYKFIKKFYQYNLIQLKKIHKNINYSAILYYFLHKPILFLVQQFLVSLSNFLKDHEQYFI